MRVQWATLSIGEHILYSDKRWSLARRRIGFAIERNRRGDFRILLWRTIPSSNLHSPTLRRPPSHLATLSTADTSYSATDPSSCDHNLPLYIYQTYPCPYYTYIWLLKKQEEIDKSLIYPTQVIDCFPSHKSGEVLIMLLIWSVLLSFYYGIVVFTHCHNNEPTKQCTKVTMTSTPKCLPSPLGRITLFFILLPLNIITIYTATISAN